MALDAPDAVLARPFLGQVPIYTSREINERQSGTVLYELDGVRFVEVPWLGPRERPVFPQITRPDLASASSDRLFALGLDAFRVAVAFAGDAPLNLEFDGATGHLALDANRQFVRDAEFLQIRDGRIEALGMR
jgi:outer membrane PBP1 activator LpoA protein